MQEKIPRLNLILAPEAGVQSEHRGERYDIRDPGRAGHEYRAEKRSQSHYRQHHGSTQSAPDLKRHYGKDVLSEIIHNPACAIRPSNFDQVSPEHNPLTKTGVLDHFP